MQGSQIQIAKQPHLYLLLLKTGYLHEAKLLWACVRKKRRRKASLQANGTDQIGFDRKEMAVKITFIEQTINVIKVETVTEWLPHIRYQIKKKKKKKKN